MIEVFDQNGRIGSEEGLVFYEQDIVKINYSFHNDIRIETKLEYINSGFGFLIEKTTANPNRTATDSFLFKLGINSFTVMRKQFQSQETIAYVSSPFEPERVEQKVIFEKIGTRIRLYSDLALLGEYNLPRDFDGYTVSLYSNKRNKVKSLLIENNVPDVWLTNVENVGDGRIQFFDHEIKFENCDQKAEVEQHDVLLPAGRYYLTKEVTGDIETRIFLSSATETDDEEKDLLIDDQYFDLGQTDLVVMRIKGREGSIKNISLQRERYARYVSTGEDIKESVGSEIIVNLEDCRFMTFRAIIANIPSDNDSMKHLLIGTNNHEITIMNSGLSPNREYLFRFNRNTMSLSIDGPSYSREFNISVQPTETFFTLLKNTNVRLFDVVVTNNEGVETNLVLQKTFKLFLPAVNKDPILVYNEYKEPLDISSAFRVIEKDGYEEYRFTNWEREYFTGEEANFILSKKALAEPGDILLYGVMNNNLKWDKLFHIKEGMDTIHEFAEHFELIPERSYGFDKDINCLDIDSSILSQYDMIVVDYLKDDSYCINYNADTETYEVDISSAQENLRVQYENVESSLDSRSRYIRTDIKPGSTNNYVVLRRV